MRLRRTRCRACSGTHVLLPARWLPRRLDEVDLIGAALLGADCGDGHRPLAARLDRPQGTVRGRLRAARDHADRLHAELAAVGAQLPEHRLGTAPTPPTALGAMGEAAARVAAAYRRVLLPGPGAGALAAARPAHQRPAPDRRGCRAELIASTRKG